MGMDEAKMIAEAMKFYNNEVNDAAIYNTLMKMEKDPTFREKLEHISKMESGHAGFWLSFLENRGFSPKKKKRAAFMGAVKLLKRIFGSTLIVPLFELGESTAVSAYTSFLESSTLTQEEQSQLRKIIMDELEHEKVFSTSKQLLKVENFRDFILGMNDGLVEILGAVAGLSAVYMHNPLLVAASGMIIGVAGALSMGIGAFISVRSQRQVNEGVKRRMELLFKVSEDRAREELLDKLVSSGMPDDVADDVVEKVAVRKEVVTRLLVNEAQEEELSSALYTGFAYLIGVFFPVVPYFFSSSSLMALPFSIALAGTVLAIMATVVSVISGMPIKKKIMEMVTTGLGAAGLTYALGYVIQKTFGLAI